MRRLIAIILFLTISMSACTPQKPATQTVLPPVQASPVGFALTATEEPKRQLPILTPTLQPISPTLTHTSTTTPSPTPEVKVEIVRFTTQDNLKLAGTLFGEGDLAVILAHMGMPDVDQQSWYPFARLIASKGFTALTFDFRGRGKSEGMQVFNTLPYDVFAAIQFLQDRGYERIVCIGASMGGTACMRAALDQPLAGLGVIASVMSNGKPNQVSAYDVQQLSLPKVFAYGNEDTPAVIIDMKIITELAPEPKLIEVYPESAHGTNLFYTKSGGSLTDLLIRFLESIRSNELIGTSNGG
jgi:alpha/beta superfamily hydrolase